MCPSCCVVINSEMRGFGKMTFYQREVLNVGGKYVSILLNRRVFFPSNEHLTNKITLSSSYLVIFKHLELYFLFFFNIKGDIPSFRIWGYFPHYRYSSIPYYRVEHKISCFYVFKLRCLSKLVIHCFSHSTPYFP